MDNLLPVHWGSPPIPPYSSSQSLPEFTYSHPFARTNAHSGKILWPIERFKPPKPARCDHFMTYIFEGFVFEVDVYVEGLF